MRRSRTPHVWHSYLRPREVWCRHVPKPSQKDPDFPRCFQTPNLERSGAATSAYAPRYYSLPRRGCGAATWPRRIVEAARRRLVQASDTRTLIVMVSKRLLPEDHRSHGLIQWKMKRPPCKISQSLLLLWRVVMFSRVPCCCWTKNSYCVVI